MRARAEAFGAIVALDAPPALVSVDRLLAKRIGIDGGDLWRGPATLEGTAVLSAPTEVHLSATERCAVGCKGCYADATPHGHEPSFDALAARLEELAVMGVFSVAFGGGEAMMREDIGELGARARTLGLVPTLTTSGVGMTEARAKKLSAFAQVNVSYDGAARIYHKVRGYDGAQHAERAMRLLQEAGVPFGVNTLLTRVSFGALEETAARVEALGAVELQLLRFKPSGRGSLDYLAQRLDEAQVLAFPAELRALSESRRLAIRVDCALVPFFSSDARITQEDLLRFGVNGCEAGRSLLALRADGRPSPCSFWRSEAKERSAREAWQEDEVLGAFRSYAAEPAAPCATCAIRSACRGGCRIVAGHLGASPFAPDPECPRVRVHQTDRVRRL